MVFTPESSSTAVRVNSVLGDMVLTEPGVSGSVAEMVVTGGVLSRITVKALSTSLFPALSVERYVMVCVPSE